jgi:hypothetical protein
MAGGVPAEHAYFEVEYYSNRAGAIDQWIGQKKSVGLCASLTYSAIIVGRPPAYLDSGKLTPNMPRLSTGLFTSAGGSKSAVAVSQADRSAIPSFWAELVFLPSNPKSSHLLCRKH